MLLFLPTWLKYWCFQGFLPQLFLLFSLSLDDLFSSFTYFLRTSNFLISSPTLSLKLQMCISNCLLGGRQAPWMSHRHLKHNMFKTEFIFSLSLYLLSYSMSQLPVRFSNLSPKLGIIFDSSYTSCHS